MDNDWIDILTKQNKTYSNYVGKLTLLKHSYDDVDIYNNIEQNIIKINSAIMINNKIMNIIINNNKGKEHGNRDNRSD